MKKIILILMLIPLNVFAIDTSASSAILLDMDNNRVLYEENSHNVRSVASISKIMTAVIAIESNKLDDKVVIGKEINKSYGSGIYIKEGEVLTLRDLVYGLMLRSGNDAALAIADYVGGSVDDFVKLMNKKAKELKMYNTTFNNPSGLDQDKGNYSTAYDMAILTSYAMKNKEYKKITSTKKYTLTTIKNTYVWINKNKLLSLYKYTTGGKTGFTEIAKRTLVSTATKNNINLVVVTLNDGNDFENHKELYEYGFNNYSMEKVFDKDKMDLPNKNMYALDDFFYPVTEEEKKLINVDYKIKDKKNYKNNEKVGIAVIKLGNKIIHEEKIYILKKEKQSSNKNLFDKVFKLLKS